MKSIPSYFFNNWAGNESCIAARYYQPETEEELVQAVIENSKIRLIGTGHSWSKICLTNSAMVNLDLYNKVVGLDKEKRLVRIQAGIKLWQLNEYLDQQGFALLNLGSISKQSAAGAISTGTHGTGIQYQVLGSQIESFTLIKADGNKLVTSARKG